MGGAGKHMLHPYENLDFTFNDIISIMYGLWTDRIPCEEKVDGVNLHFSFVKSHARFARRVSHTEFDGYTVADMHQRLKNHPGRKQFLLGVGLVDDIATKAKKSIKDWPQGKWVNAEVISGSSPQCLKYDRDCLIFHDYVNKHPLESRMLPVHEDALRSNYNMKKKLFAEQFGTVLSKLPVSIPNRPTDLVDTFALDIKKRVSYIFPSSSNPTHITLKNYVYEKTYIKCKRLMISDEISTEICDLIFYKKGSIRKIRKKLTEWQTPLVNAFALSKFRENHIKNCLKPIILIWKKYSAMFLSDIDSALISDSKAERKRLMSLMRHSIKEVHKHELTGDGTILTNLNKSLNEFNNLMVPPPTIEGVVFEIDGIKYKATGAFPSMNRVTGAARYELGIPFPGEKLCA